MVSAMTEPYMPSSNYLIGTIQKYEAHPILRFNSRYLHEFQKNMSVCVSINTDDQGVFDTLLENEYALMAQRRNPVICLYNIWKTYIIWISRKRVTV